MKVQLSPIASQRPAIRPTFGVTKQTRLTEAEYQIAKAAFVQALGVQSDAPIPTTNEIRAAFSKNIRAAFDQGFHKGQYQSVEFATHLKSVVEKALGKFLQPAKAFDLFTRILNASDQGLMAAIQSGIELGPQ